MNETPVNETLTTSLPVLTLHNGVVLPQMVLTLTLETEDARAAVDAAMEADSPVLLVPAVGERSSAVGTVAAIDQAGDLPGGARAVFLRGLRRARVGTTLPGAGDALWVSVEEVDEGEVTDEQRRLAEEYRAVLENILEHRKAPQIADFVRSVDGPSALADIMGYSPDIDFDQKVELLETLDLTERLGKVLVWGRQTLAALQLKEKVRADVSENLERGQREAILRQQMAAIRKELGDDDSSVIEEYRSQLAQRDLPEHVEHELSAEIDKLERTPEQAAEHGWIRSWIDAVLAFPWDVRSDEHLDLAAARAQLDVDHTGLQEVKERLLEFLAVRKLRSERAAEASPGADSTSISPASISTGSNATDRPGAGAILVLVGPPGVGKTSLGRSVAEALGRPYVRVALGGVRDEAEIRGHRRTYVGARAGRIVKAIEEAGAMNPVMVLDEIDKVGSDWRGDPSSALLEVLDPAQNSTFRDHYLELDVDLSDVVFVATANVLETIPPALLDRLEVIEIDGYTTAEKVAIARDHLVGRQLDAAGLTEEDVRLTDDALRVIIEGYTREAGVRGLERKLGAVMRKVATRVATDESGTGNQAAAASSEDEASDDDTGESDEKNLVDTENVRELLGRPRHRIDEQRPTDVPGVATGLAVTGAGGDVLIVETARVDDRESTSERPIDSALELTGQLGDVMKESAQIVLSYLRANPEVLRDRLRDGTDEDPSDALHRGRFHVHFPAGAIPKDGPSAGVTMTTALASLLTGRPMRSEVAMTGEVSLIGRVLPIGGVKQKLLAAHRAGITEVVLPADNEADLDDVPEDVLAGLEVHLASHVGEVLDHALV